MNSGFLANGHKFVLELCVLHLTKLLLRGPSRINSATFERQAKMRKGGAIARRLMDQLGADACQLVPFQETVDLQQLWRETFAQRVHDATGKWTHLQFDWHAFSYEFVYCLERDKARSAYGGQIVSQVVVLPNMNEELACRCKTSVLPNLDGLDAYVCDPGLAWTMVFTHEIDWCGPYFTTAEWAEGRDPGKKRAGRR